MPAFNCQNFTITAEVELVGSLQSHHISLSATRDFRRRRGDIGLQLSLRGMNLLMTKAEHIVFMTQTSAISLSSSSAAADSCKMRKCEKWQRVTLHLKR